MLQPNAAPDRTGPERRIEHVPGPVYAGLMLQLDRTASGKGSNSSTLNAVPVPVALLLRTIIVNPAVDPAGTGVASGVFVTLRFGGVTTIVAVVLIVGPLSRLTDAVFEYVPAKNVGVCTWTEN